jgi:selenocysteine lyase/cysteine desulfurase
VLDLDPGAIGADVIAAHGYKFLCAGFGLAVVWCSQRAIEELRPPLVGWKNAAAEADAARFEPTMPSLASLAGLQASLSLLNEVDEREPRALALAARVAEVLGVPETGSPIVTAPRPELVPRLAAAGIACAEVDGAVRFSTHVFNTDEDVDRLAAAV